MSASSSRQSAAILKPRKRLRPFAATPVFEARGIFVYCAAFITNTARPARVLERIAVKANDIVLHASCDRGRLRCPKTGGRLGTNPICSGFPSADEPIILDIGTSAIAHAEVILARRLGNELPVGVAFDHDGLETRDPAAALAGAFATWGGHRGSGLAIVLQLLGIMAGSPPIPPELAGYGFLIVAMRPDLLGSAETFRGNVSAFARAVRSARPVAGGPPFRMPFDRSRQERQRRISQDAIEIPDVLYSRRG